MPEHASPSTPHPVVSSESFLYVLITSLLHLVIAFLFLVLPQLPQSGVNPRVFPADVHVVWGILFLLTSFFGFFVCIHAQRSWYWVASSLFASVCGMWVVVDLYALIAMHGEILPILLWLYLAAIHIQRARHKPYDYAQANILLHHMEQLRDATAATSLYTFEEDVPSVRDDDTTVHLSI